MSEETYEWLNTKVLIGHTGADSPHARVPGVEYRAWHDAPAKYENGESNHYSYGIPVEDIDRRLLDFKILEAPFEMPFEVLTDDGVSAGRLSDPGRKVLFRSDNHSVLSVVGSGFSVPDYRRDVVDYAAGILAGSDLEIMSAGLLKGGARFWGQFVLPEGKVTAGFAYSPWLTITDSCDGRPWTMLTGSTASICDNTLTLAIRTAVNMAKVRHTVNRRDLMHDAASVIGIITDFGDEFSKRVDILANTPVTDVQWEKFMDAHWGPTGPSKRSQTVAQKNREALTLRYATDPMCAPWAGTALGVVQTVNTEARHATKRVGTAALIDDQTRHLNRMTLDGFYGELDAKTIRELNKAFKATRVKQIQFA
jgi:phage/plasmid-like protein (TIGR03299 family)